VGAPRGRLLHRPGGGPADLAGERLERPGRQRARVRALGEDDLGAQRQELAEHPRGVLVVEDGDDGDDRAAGGERAQRPGQRRHPRGVVGAVDDRRGRLGDDLEASGDERPGRGLHDRGVVERPVVGLGRRARDGEVALLDLAPGEQLQPAVGRRDDERGAALGAHLLRQRHRVLVQVGPDDERAARPDDVELLGRDVGDRRAEPARVLEADVRQDLDLRGDHVRRVPAPAEAGLDDDDVRTRLGQLAVGGGRQGLELGDAVALLERAVDLLGRPLRPRDGGGEALLGEIGVVDADALGERDEVRREVGAGPQPVAAQDGSGHADGRRLAVRPDDVDRPGRRLRRAERGEQPTHALQPEAHAEQLEPE